MKRFIIAFSLLGMASVMAAPVTYEDAPITGNDVAEVLKLNIQKFKLTFDSPKKIKIEVLTSHGTNKQELEIKGVASTATLRMCYPEAPKDGSYVKIDYKLTTDSGGGIESSLHVDWSKIKCTSAHPSGNDFVVEGLDEKDAAEQMKDPKKEPESPVFKLRIITSN